ncbi:AAA family ATPase [Methylobacterium currus]|uniref:KGGVGR-motif variant AAA ATPase n=1 Tax=Methylobacterium currus TaxID=2051553 RepID=UPI001E5F3E74|nr:AAA family ATPase [Methylobacterium currus]UHC16549.1 AAA family ATPase [Methylobacterium currus]
METITFYSYKGGVGRTLALANVGHYLALLGKRVLALDFDLEAPGLHYKLIPEIAERRRIKFGLIDYIDDLLNNRPIQSLSDLVVNIPLLKGAEGQLHLIPAGNAPSPSYWTKLSGFDWQQLLYGGSAEGALLFIELKERIIRDLNPDFLLIDARTGITETGGIATTLLADKIVCLLTPMQENLEGARSVLRALLNSPRPPGMPPAEIYPVLSRLSADAATEKTIVSQTLNFLNEPALELEYTLSFDDLTILHSDSDLLRGERILVGGSSTPEKSQLLQDYLGLFSKISYETIRSSTAPIIERALRNIIDFPDQSQKEIENLAYSFNAPEAFRELVKVYRLRNVSGEQMLSAAYRLWLFRQESDLSLLNSCIASSFREVYRWSSKDRNVNLDFIEDVWMRADNPSTKVAIDLAKSFNNFDEKERALEILRKAFVAHESDDAVFVQLLKQMTMLEKFQEGRSLVDNNLDKVLSSPSLLTAWAKLELKNPDGELPPPLTKADALYVLEEAGEIETFVRLLSRSGRAVEARARAEALLMRAITTGNAEAIFESGKLLSENGRASELSMMLRRRFDELTSRRIENAIFSDEEHVMPSSYDLRDR